jgi:hypothetical protein
MTSPSDHQSQTKVALLTIFIVLLVCGCCFGLYHRRRLLAVCSKKKRKNLSYTNLSRNDFENMVNGVFEDGDEDLDEIDFEMSDLDLATRSASSGSLSIATSRSGFAAKGSEVKMRLDFDDIERTPKKSSIATSTYPIATPTPSPLAKLSRNPASASTPKLPPPKSSGTPVPKLPPPPSTPSNGDS